jgi:hypothetical protein
VQFYSKKLSFSFSNKCSANCFGQGAVVLRRPARPCGARLRGHQRPHHATPQASRRRRHALPQAPHPEAPRSPRGPRVGRHAVPIGARRGPSVRRRHPAVRASAEEAVLRQHLRRHGDVTREGLAYKGRSDRTHPGRRLPHCPPSAAIRATAATTVPLVASAVRAA